MTNSVVIPIKLRLTSGIITHQVAAASITFGANGVNVATLNIAVGHDELGNIASLGLHRGQEANVEVSGADITSDAVGQFTPTLASSQFILFRGIVDDYGPGNLSFGQFVLQVRLVSKLAWLAQGNVSSSNITSNNFFDAATQFQFGEGVKDKILIDPGVASINMWTGIQQALRRVAQYVPAANSPQDTVSKAIRAIFGSTANTKASEILQAITGSLMTWRADRSAQERAAIVFNMNQYLTSEWAYEPFLNRVVTMGEMLQFSIIETGQGIQVVPYVPFFKRTDAFVISPDTYSSISQPLAPYKNYAGVILVDGGGRDPGAATVGASPLGLYAMPGTSSVTTGVYPFGQVQVSQMPGYLGLIDQAMMTGGKNVRGFSGGVPTTLAQVVANTTSMATMLAKFNCWELNYRERHIQVTCPFFRTDIGPLTAVRVDFPATAEIRLILETPAVYGSVQSVTLSVDATTGFMQTVYDIGFVRSHLQQKTFIDPGLLSGFEHTFFNNNYIGARLDSSQPRVPTAVGSPNG